MANDISQIGVVAKNEIIKCARGRKFLISLVIVFVVFLLITGLQFVMDSWDNLDSIGALTEAYLSTFPMVIVLIVALLSSIALVSEFEERTALILFTRPVRRTSILIGKILACTIVEALIILVYYILVATVGFLKIDGMSLNFLTSFGFAVMYAFATSGVAFVISAFLKKSSVCTVISILLMLVIFPIVSTMVEANDGESWYMIDQAGETIYTCIPEYVDRYNETLDQFDDVIGQAIAILEGFTDQDVQIAVQAFMDYYQTLDPESQAAFAPLLEYLNTSYSQNLYGMIFVLKMMSGSALLAPMENPDLLKEFLILLVWGIAGYFVAWIRFVRREF